MKSGTCLDAGGEGVLLPVQPQVKEGRRIHDVGRSPVSSVPTKETSNAPKKESDHAASGRRKSAGSAASSPGKGGNQKERGVACGLGTPETGLSRAVSA